MFIKFPQHFVFVHQVVTLHFLADPPRLAPYLFHFFQIVLDIKHGFTRFEQYLQKNGGYIKKQVTREV